MRRARLRGLWWRHGRGVAWRVSGRRAHAQRAGAWRAGSMRQDMPDAEVCAGATGAGAAALVGALAAVISILCAIDPQTAVGNGSEARKGDFDGWKPITNLQGTEEKIAKLLKLRFILEFAKRGANSTLCDVVARNDAAALRKAHGADCKGLRRV